MAATLKADQEQLVRAAYDRGLTVGQARKLTGFGGETIRKRYREYDREVEGGPGDDGDAPSSTTDVSGATPPHPDEHVTFEEAGDAGKLTCVTRDQVQSEEDLVRVCKIDLTRWRIVRMKVKAYQAAMKLEVKEKPPSGVARRIEQRPVTVQLFSVSADLERVLPRRELDALESLFDSMATMSPRYPSPAILPARAPLLADVCLYDCHFANLAWEPESGENDDLRIKMGVFANAVDDIVSRIREHDIDEVVFPVGNDLHHVDTLLRTTTAGTPQDTDGRYAKMIEATQKAVIRAIERLLDIPTLRKVNVLYVPGNHDRLTSYHLCLTLDAWFRNCDRIEVDSAFRTRKYLHRGVCLLGYTHGDHANEGKMKSLPTIMAVEQPQAWAATTCREWKTGHLHTSKSYETLSSNEFNGVQVRRLRALTGPNAWHFDHGYVGNKRGAEVYLYDPSEGYVGHLVANARAS